MKKWLILLLIFFVGGVATSYFLFTGGPCPAKDAYVYGMFIPDGFAFPITGWSSVEKGSFDDPEDFITTGDMTEILKEACDCGDDEEVDKLDRMLEEGAI